MLLFFFRVFLCLQSDRELGSRVKRERDGGGCRDGVRGRLCIGVGSDYEALPVVFLGDSWFLSIFC